MSLDKEKLYQLIPAVYRIKDEAIAAKKGEAKGPLKAFIELFADQVAMLDDNLDQLYNDQFIETCAEWVVPYIGDLVGARDLLSIPGASFSQRAQVANTLSYRRRKGTASVIEQLARDITGWPANVVEYFQKLATTQYLNHLRPKNLAFASVKNLMSRELAKTPFNTYEHTIDVRSIDLGRGKYNISNIGIFLWRILPMSVTRAPAYKVGTTQFTFDCIGRDSILYFSPRQEEEISQLATTENVPMPISRLKMFRQLKLFYGKSEKSIWLNNIPVNEIAVCNLRDDENGAWINMPVDKVTVDPESGRIAFPEESAPEKLYVNYYYGAPGLIGAGEYTSSSTAFFEEETVTLRVPEVFATIQEALDLLATTGGIIELTSNDYYFETPVINIEEGRTIEIRAAEKKRPILVLSGDLNLYAGDSSKLYFNGIFVVGGCLHVPLTKPNGFNNEIGEVHIENCTLLPGSSPEIENVPAQPAQPRVVIETPGSSLYIKNTISGALLVHEHAACFIDDSIIDAIDENNSAFKGLTDFGGALTIVNTTVIGQVSTTLLSLASNTIFLSGSVGGSPVSVHRRQEGCVRFSYVPLGSVVPKKYKCQPENISDAGRVKPIFNSLQFGDADYVQLHQHCAREILMGADNESEMGVFNALYQPQRISNLKHKLNEYLPFGLEAGIFFGS